MAMMLRMGSILYVRLRYAGFKTCDQHELAHDCHALLCCEDCHIVLKIQADTTGDPIEWHVNNSPRCPFLKRMLEQRLHSRAAPESDEGEYQAISIQDTERIPPLSLMSKLLMFPPDHLQKIQDSLKSSNSSVASEERCRRETFRDHWKIDNIVSSADLAENGFVYLKPDDVAKCIYCQIELGQWTPDMSVKTRHMKESPECPFVQGRVTTKNTPDLLKELELDENGNQLYDSLHASNSLGLRKQNVHHPEMAVLDHRKQTFLTWPCNLQKQPEDFFAVGLFYTGIKDEVCCYWCGITMRGWSGDEDVWVRHVRQSPACELVKQTKGMEFITTTLAEHGPYIEPCRSPTINNVTTRMLRPRLDGEVAQATRKLGYPVQAIVDAFKEQIKYGDKDFATIFDLVMDIKKRTNAIPDGTIAPSEVSVPPEIVRPPVPQSQPSPTANQPPRTFRRRRDPADSSSSPQVDVNSTPRAGVNKLNSHQTIEMARQMKLQLTCKICMDTPVDTILLPCGHLIACSACSSALSECAMCRKLISARIHVLMGTLQAPLTQH